MLFSLENRLPFLDNDILDLSLHTDSSLMVRGTGTKKCLKALISDKIPGSIGLNPIKQGFSPPLVSMFRKELKEWKENWLNFKSPFFKPEMPAVLSGYECKGWDLHRLYWNICVLNDWGFRNQLF